MERGRSNGIRHHEEEKLVVTLTNTRSSPRTMMVHSENAPVTDGAMVTARRLDQITFLAVLIADYIPKKVLIRKHAIELFISPIDGLSSLNLQFIFPKPLFMLLILSVHILHFYALVC